MTSFNREKPKSSKTGEIQSLFIVAAKMCDCASGHDLAFESKKKKDLPLSKQIGEATPYNIVLYSSEEGGYVLTINVP